MATSFSRKLEAACGRLGGPYNAHLHLDRSNTLDTIYVDLEGADILQASYISLQESTR